MRITTWNCNGSPRITSAATAARVYQDKARQAATLAPDILVLQEVPSPGASNDAHVAWYGSLLGRGMAVIAPAPYSVALIPDLAPSRSHLAVQIRGPVNLLLLAICSSPERPSARSYVAEVAAAIARCRSQMLLQPTIIAGDFNSNSQWDARLGTDSHSALVRNLADEHGLQSCYHRYHGVAQGQEPAATYYHHRRANAPFHIDYCFVPARWEIADACIGSHAAWSPFSDHCPLTVDIALPEAASVT